MMLLYSNLLSFLLRAALLVLILPWSITLGGSPFSALTVMLFIGWLSASIAPQIPIPSLGYAAFRARSPSLLFTTPLLSWPTF